MKCPKCGKKFSGNICPDCAADVIDAMLDEDGPISDIPTPPKKFDFSTLSIPKVFFLSASSLAIVFLALWLFVGKEGTPAYEPSYLTDPAHATTTAPAATEPSIAYDSWESCFHDIFSDNCAFDIKYDSSSNLTVNISGVKDWRKAFFQVSAIALHMSPSKGFPASSGLSPINGINFIFEPSVSIVLMKNSESSMLFPLGVTSFIHFNDDAKNAAELQTYYDEAFVMFDATGLFE